MISQEPLGDKIPSTLVIGVKHVSVRTKDVHLDVIVTSMICQATLVMYVIITD